MLRPVGGPGVLKTHDAFLIYDDVRAFTEPSSLIPYTEGLHHLPIPVAEKRMFNLGEIDKGLLGEDRVGADPQNLGIFCLEFCVIVVRTGRLEMLNSGGAKVQDIEIDQNILSPQGAELEFAPFGALEFKIWGHLSHFDRKSGKGGGEEEGK